MAPSPSYSPARHINARPAALLPLLVPFSPLRCWTRLSPVAVPVPSPPPPPPLPPSPPPGRFSLWRPFLSALPLLVFLRFSASAQRCALSLVAPAAYGPGRRRCRLPYFCCRFPHPSLKIPPKKRRRFTKSFGPLSHVSMPPPPPYLHKFMIGGVFSMVLGGGGVQGLPHRAWLAGWLAGAGHSPLSRRPTSPADGRDDGGRAGAFLARQPLQLHRGRRAAVRGGLGGGSSGRPPSPSQPLRDRAGGSPAGQAG